MAKLHYFVTRTPNRGFVALLTLDEIRRDLAAGRLAPDYYATESDGRSFKQFQRDGDRARWRTLAELVSEAPAPAPPPGPPPVRRLSGYFVGGALSWLLLVIGLLTSAVACVAIPVGVVYQLQQLAEVEDVVKRAGRAGDPAATRAASGVGSARAVVVGVGVLAFCLNAAMLVVFKRANALAAIAADQDAENRYLRHAIAELRGPPGSPRAGASPARAAPAGGVS